MKIPLFFLSLKNLSRTRIVIFAITSIIVVSALVFLVWYLNYKENRVEIPDGVTLQAGSSGWWDGHYAYRQKISLANSFSKNAFKINHANLVVDLKSKPDGLDLKIIGQSEQNYLDIPFSLSSIDSVETQIIVDPTITNSTEYFLYYGNKASENKSFAELSDLEDIKDIALLGGEETPILSITPFKTWVAKENNEVGIGFKIKSSLYENRNHIDLFYKLDTDESATKFGSTDQIESVIELNLGDVSSGKHELFVVGKDKRGDTYRSNTISFIVSSPVYVVITSSWAGIDVEDSKLKLIEDVSKEYSFPITHFFSPRIFIHVKIPSYRKKELADWILRRNRDYGDEIALGLFMQHDLVLEAGVKPKDKTQGWDRDTRGYDTPGSWYSQEEYEKILKWSIEQFSKNNFPQPVGFRAGGWFANIDTLKAIEKVGFKYDSSAIQPFKIGMSEITQEWLIMSTSQAYYPDYSDQSEPGKMNFLEIPTNGGSIEWLSETDLIVRFYDNYEVGQIPDESKVVVYSIHPEWFDTEVDKLKALLDEVSIYRFDLDSGPVRFVTLNEYIKFEYSGKI